MPISVFWLAFSNFVAAFHSCTAFHPLCAYFGDTLGLSLSSRRQSYPGISFFGVAPASFCVSSLLSLLAKFCVSLLENIWCAETLLGLDRRHRNSCRQRCKCQKPSNPSATVHLYKMFAMNFPVKIAAWFSDPWYENLWPAALWIVEALKVARWNAKPPFEIRSRTVLQLSRFVNTLCT